MTQEQLKTDLNISEEIRIKDKSSYSFLANNKLISLTYDGAITVRNIVSGSLEFKKQTKHQYIYVINKWIGGLTKKLLSIYEYKNKILTKRKSIKVLTDCISKVDGSQLVFINETDSEIYDFSTSKIKQLKLNFTSNDGQLNKVLAVSLTPHNII